MYEIEEQVSEYIHGNIQPCESPTVDRQFTLCGDS